MKDKQVFISYARDLQSQANQLSHDIKRRYKDWGIYIHEEEKRKIRPIFGSSVSASQYTPFAWAFLCGQYSGGYSDP